MLHYRPGRSVAPVKPPRTVIKTECHCRSAMLAKLHLRHRCFTTRWADMSMFTELVDLCQFNSCLGHPRDTCVSKGETLRKGCLWAVARLYRTYSLMFICLVQHPLITTIRTRVVRIFHKCNLYTYIYFW